MMRVLNDTRCNPAEREYQVLMTSITWAGQGPRSCVVYTRANSEQAAITQATMCITRQHAPATPQAVGTVTVMPTEVPWAPSQPTT